MLETVLTYAVPLVLGLIGLGLTKYVLSLRRVVSTNEVHIVQSSKTTTSYGKDTGHGNVYYEWPAFLPFIGVVKTVFQVSNFDIDLEDYEAYDEGRLPFVVDVKAFFRITDSNVAAQRVATFEELKEQLKAVVQGAVRSILASNSIEEIMQGRSKFGNEFTKEVDEQLTNWGVQTVKSIELMDIRDHQGSKVIHNIMEKKKSLIEMESRTEVAKNRKSAEIAEIEAKREVDLQAQAALQAVGLRTTQNEREVALAQQEKEQVLKEQQKLTKEKEMSVLKVEQLRKAEIAREVQLVQAEQQKQTAIISAEGDLESKRRLAEATLELKKREAEGIALEGQAKADAEKAMQLAPVQAQITLAKEIGSNESYQKYLVTIRQVEASQAIGIEQAKALSAADVKVIANSGNATSGLNSVLDVISSKGGVEIGAMLEGLSATPVGQGLINKFVGATTTAEQPKPEAPLNGKGNGKANGAYTNGKTSTF